MKTQFQHKMNFTERFKKRHSLRFHMSLILLATVCSGFFATRIMLGLHLENVMLRYPLAVIFAYLVFFISVKLWLKYVAPMPTTQHAHGNSPDVLDLLPNMSLPGQSDAYLPFHGGGGGFDGGGATGSFGDATGDAAGEAVSALGDEGGFVAMAVFAVLAAIMAVVVGAGVYLVYEAPFILSEAAFEFILAASLVRGTRRIDSADWMGSVIKTTGIPFMVTLALALLAGYLMHHHFPGVTRVSELISRL